MIRTIVIVLIFVGLLVIEWRYKLRSVRLGAVFLAVVLAFFTGGNLTAARRQALDMPAAQRITQVAGHQVSDYASGVFTMAQAASDSAMFETEYSLSWAVLLWLACSPAFRRAHTPSTTASGRVSWTETHA